MNGLKKGGGTGNCERQLKAYGARPSRHKNPTHKILRYSTCMARVLHMYGVQVSNAGQGNKYVCVVPRLRATFRCKVARMDRPGGLATSGNGQDKLACGCYNIWWGFEYKQNE